MRKRHLRLAICGSILLVCPLFLQFAVGNDHASYPILDSKLPVDEQTHPVWLNNRQIIFTGYEVDPDDPPKQTDNVWVIPRAVYVWDIETGIAARDYSWYGTNSWCVAGVFRSFHRLRLGTEKIYDLVQGRVGEEEVQPLPARWFNPVSCRHYYTALPYWRHEGQKGRSIPLLDEHGYLDFGLPSRADPSKASPVLLYQPNETNPKYLPFTGEQVRLHVSYSEFANVYLLEGYRETTYAPRIWLLKPDGTVTTALEPTGKAWERMGWGHFFLTKKGLLITGGRGDYGSVGTSGGYLYSGGNPTRIVPGFLRNVAVSPDGCRIVFVHALHSQAEADSVNALREGKSGTRTLKMIDLCKGD